MNNWNDVGKVRTQPIEGGFDFGINGIGFKGGEIVVGQSAVSFLQTNRDQFFRFCGITEVGEAKTDAVGFVRISRANATLGGSDFLIAQRHFAGGIKLAVIGEDNVGTVGNEKAFGCDGNAFGFEGFDFLAETDRIHDDTVSDDALFIPKNAGGNEMEDIFFALGDHGVPGVVSALTANDEVRFFGQEIDNLALAFVAPVEAANDGVH